MLKGTKSSKKVIGRPKKKLDRKLINELIDQQLSIRAIAEITNLARATIASRFRPKLQKRKYKAIIERVKKRQELRRAQWDLAIKDKNPLMQIWLGKNELGQTNKIETTANKVKTITKITHN